MDLRLLGIAVVQMLRASKPGRFSRVITSQGWKSGCWSGRGPRTGVPETPRRLGTRTEAARYCPDHASDVPVAAGRAPTAVSSSWLVAGIAAGSFGTSDAPLGRSCPDP